jgi:hypothetical protein
MNMPGTAAPAGSSLLRDWLNALRYWLGGRTGVIVSLGLLAAIGIGLGWSWLVAVGVAPLLVAVLPCAAMCALGLCASRLGGRGCSSEAKTPSPEPQVGIQASMRAPGQELGAARGRGASRRCSRGRRPHAAE